MFKNWHIAGAVVIGMTSAAQAEEHMVVLTGFSYFPGVTYAQPGDTIRFINESGEDQTVVGKDTGWVVGPLSDQEEGVLVVDAETELAFFAAYNANTEDDDDGDDDEQDDDEDFGNYEEAPIRAEITFEDAPLNG